MLWLGDLETDFMKTIEDEIELPEVDIVFAAHHGRARMPSKWMAQMDLKVVVLGEALPEHLEYYSNRNHAAGEPPTLPQFTTFAALFH
jgi:hypothetical protein